MRMIHKRTKQEVNVTEWATLFGKFEFYLTDHECDEGYRVAVVYGPDGDVEVGEVDLNQFRKLPGFFAPSPITKNTLPAPGWRWAS